MSTKRLIILAVIAAFFGVIFLAPDKSKQSNVQGVDAAKTFSSEEEQLLDAANNFVREHSVEGMEFSLTLERRVGDWSIFGVTPKNVETDPAQLFMQKVNGKWEGRALGTAFPELYEAHPELF